MSSSSSSSSRTTGEWEMPPWKGKLGRHVTPRHLQVMGFSVPSLATDVALSRAQIQSDLSFIDTNSRYDDTSVAMSFLRPENCSAEELEKMSNPALRKVLMQLREHARVEADAVGAKSRELVRLRGEEEYLQKRVEQVNLDLKRTEASSVTVLSQFERKTTYLAGLIRRCSDLIADMQNVFSTGLQIAHGLDIKDESVAETATLLKSRQLHVDMLAKVVSELNRQGTTVEGVLDATHLAGLQEQVNEVEQSFYSHKEALELKLKEINDLEQSLRARQNAYRERLRQLASARTKRRKLADDINETEHEISIFNAEDLADPERSVLSDTRRSLYRELLAIVERRSSEAEACVTMVLGESNVLREQLTVLDQESQPDVDAYVTKLGQKVDMESELRMSREEYTRRQEGLKARNQLVSEAQNSKQALELQLSFLKQALVNKKFSVSAVRKTTRELQSRVEALRADPMVAPPVAAAPKRATGSRKQDVGAKGKSKKRKRRT